MIKKQLSAAGFVLLSVLVASAALLLSAAPLHAASAKSDYDSKCAMCHASDGSGSTATGKALNVPDLRSKAVQAESNKQLYEIIANGKSPMPGYASQLSKAQINALVAYIRALAKKR